MTILLVFLIKSFSVEGHIVTPSEDLRLPVSTSQKPPEPVAKIEISRGFVMAEGVAIAPVASFSSADSLTIPALFDWMLAQKTRAGAEAESRGVMILSDRDTEFNVMKRVMYTCSKAGFDDFSILVMSEE